VNLLVLVVAAVMASDEKKSQEKLPAVVPDSFSARYWKLVARQLASQEKKTATVRAAKKAAQREFEDEKAAIALEYRRLMEEAKSASGCNVATGKDGLECQK
jgi:hypothetical protein